MNKIYLVSVILLIGGRTLSLQLAQSKYLRDPDLAQAPPKFIPDTSVKMVWFLREQSIETENFVCSYRLLVEYCDGEVPPEKN